MSSGRPGPSSGLPWSAPTGGWWIFFWNHGVVVFLVDPRALDRARDRFRMSQAKSDPFDAPVLAPCLRTEHAHLHALPPSSEAAQALKLLTRDYARRVREQTRLLNQLTVTLKEDSPPRPRALPGPHHPAGLGLPPGLPDAGGPGGAHAEAVAALRRESPRECCPSHRLVGAPPRAPAARAAACGGREESTGRRRGAPARSEPGGPGDYRERR
jgi:hypothetical protein